MIKHDEARMNVKRYGGLVEYFIHKSIRGVHNRNIDTLMSYIAQQEQQEKELINVHKAYDDLYGNYKESVRMFRDLKTAVKRYFELLEKIKCDPQIYACFTMEEVDEGAELEKTIKEMAGL